VEEAAIQRPEMDRRPVMGELAGKVLQTGSTRGNRIRHSRKGRCGARSGEEGPLAALGPAPHAGSSAGEAGTDPHAPATSTGVPTGEAATAVGRGWGAAGGRAHARRRKRLLRRWCACQGRRPAPRRGEGRWRGREVSARQPWEERRATRRLPCLWRGAAAVALRPLKRCVHVGAARWRGAAAALRALQRGVATVAPPA
jgi:hypothetical protein